MYSQVIFYNHFGAGDIFESREFVKEWMKLVPAEKYCYSHSKNPRILLDIPELEFKGITEHMNPMRGVWDDLNGNLYVNTWIGRDGKYVLPGIGCTVEKIFQMHNDMLAVYKLGRLSGSPIDYIPIINYDYYDIEDAIKFIFNEGRDFIYIDNGLVQSMQAKNFDLNPVINRIAKACSDKAFLVTHKFQAERGNIYFTSDYTKGVGFDLNEVSFFSLFCRVLIGRNSGPHVYSQVQQNVFDGSKKLLSFTYHQQGSSFVVNTDVKIQKIWSSATDINSVTTKILETIQ